MKAEQKPFDTKSVLLGAALGAVIMFSLAASTDRPQRVSWEYKTVAAKVLGDDLGRAINAEAAAGWDFVSASPSLDQWGFAVLRREKKP